MKVLVTGGAGFVGSHLVDRLVERGDDVTVWDNHRTGHNKNDKAVYYELNVDDVHPIFHYKKGYEVIYHLAAEARIQPSFDNPNLVHHSNVTGTSKMLELARLGKSRFVFAGSSSVYHDIYANPYSFSKHVGEEYCRLYHQIYKVPVAIARFFNVYGPRQIEDGKYATVIGVFERQRREGVPLTITGDGNQRRDFTHVSDIVDGLVAMGQADFKCDIFNLGTGKNYSINEVALLFKHTIVYIDRRPGEATQTKADISWSEEKLGYAPKVRLEDYIRSLGQGEST